MYLSNSQEIERKYSPHCILNGENMASVAEWAQTASVPCLPARPRSQHCQSHPGQAGDITNVYHNFFHLRP